MAENYTRGNKLFEYTFDEKSTPERTAIAVRNAFIEGFTCFKFYFRFNKRVFTDNHALRTEVHDESDAYDLGLFAFARFTNSLRQCIAQA